MNAAEVLRGYIECALWSSVDGDGTPLDDSRYDGVLSLAPETLASMLADVESFLEGCVPAHLEGLDASQVGHDFWLTRNHHGAGFWDRGLGERGEMLTAWAHTFGGVDLYVGDDGKIHS